MTVGDIVAMCIRQAGKYGIKLTREEIIDTLNAELSTVAFDLGYPISVWESTSSKPSTTDIIDFPPQCIDVQEVFIGGEKASKQPISLFEENFKGD